MRLCRVVWVIVAAHQRIPVLCVCRAAGRDLQRWEPDEGDDFSASTLEGDGSAAWDQFAVNKAKFGVETTYDENVYTVALNRGNCAITEAEAARLAREIETAGAGSGMAKLHMLEERGLEVADEVNHPAVAACEADASCCSADVKANPVPIVVSQMNEEDRYGAVLRPELGGYQGNAGRGRPTYPNQYARATPNPNPPNSQGRAWGGAGAGVAAVAGRQAYGPGGHHPMGPQASHAAAGPRARQDYDQRLEQHKVPTRSVHTRAGQLHCRTVPDCSRTGQLDCSWTGQLYCRTVPAQGKLLYRPEEPRPLRVKHCVQHGIWPTGYARLMDAAAAKARHSLSAPDLSHSTPL
ncbi:hypothetical protein V8C86DRAFT_1183459 [Haematococcus lacustris]